MTIALCDDDKRFLSFLDKKLHTYLEMKEITFIIKHYRSGEELLHCNINQIDLVFLDIRMAELDGIQVAHILRRRNPDFILIFVSSYIEYAPYGYESKALRYILKEHIETLFDELMESVLVEFGYFRTKMTFNFSFGTESFFTDNLFYVESKLHTVHFYLAGKTRYLYETLDSVQKILPEEEFLRIHKSYLVNIKHLFDMKNYIAYLDNGVQLPVSQKKFSETKKALYLYRGKI